MKKYFRGNYDGVFYNITVNDMDSFTEVVILLDNSETDFHNYYDSFSGAMDALYSSFDELIPVNEETVDYMSDDLTGHYIIDHTNSRSGICLSDDNLYITLLYYSQILKEYTTIKVNKRVFLTKNNYEIKKETDLIKSVSIINTYI